MRDASSFAFDFQPTELSRSVINYLSEQGFRAYSHDIDTDSHDYSPLKSYSKFLEARSERPYLDELVIQPNCEDVEIKYSWKPILFKQLTSGLRVSPGRDSFVINSDIGSELFYVGSVPIYSVVLSPRKID